MKPIIQAAVIAAIIATPVAHAQVFKCEKNGRKVFQSKPCSPGDRPADIRAPDTSTHQVAPRNNLREFLNYRQSKRGYQDSSVERRAAEARQRRLSREYAEQDRQRIKRARFNDRVVVGMSARDVRSTWGQPDKINPSQSQRGEIREQWVYYENDRTSYVYLRNGKVTSTSTYNHDD